MPILQYFSPRSLRIRIAYVVLGVGLFTSLAVLFYQEHTLVGSITEAQEENSRNLVNTVTLFVESHYRSISRQKLITMDRRKDLLKTAIELAIVQVEIAHNKMLIGELSEEEAKHEAILALKTMRYDHNVGYVWVNTLERPFARMIMHPTIPDLDGEILDHDEFNCALGREENLFNAMVDVCLEKGSGYVDYFWPKPTPTGLTPKVAKLSYVKLFEPWGWVIGSGLYIDDIEKTFNIRLLGIARDLQKTFPRVKVGDTGYMFVFNSNQEMLIHPVLTGQNMENYPNPETGNPVLLDLMNAAKSPSQKLVYKWNKPPEFSDQYIFTKVAYVQYFEPLDWYITSTVYYEETKRKIEEIRVRVIILAGILLMLGLGISIWLSRSLTNPLQKLSGAAKVIQEHTDEMKSVPVSGTIETRELGEVLNSMLSSLQSEITERKQAEITLKKALQEKEVLLREVHHRVKNNMAVVISMLNMQAKRVKDVDVLSALEESRNRISAMSLIHETLYISEHLAEIHIHEYIIKIFKALQQIMMNVPGGVTLEIEGDPIALTVEQAVPCGLALNELITNSFKYGYPDGGPGKINIKTTYTKDNWVCLEYVDNGVGLKEDFDPQKVKTLGLRIVKLLIENQLKGNIEIISGTGAGFKLEWPSHNMESK